MDVIDAFVNEILQPPHSQSGSWVSLQDSRNNSNPTEGTHAMLDTPQIIQTTARLTAIIHLTIPKNEIQSAMGPGIGELMAAIAAQGIAPAGPWFTHHFRIDPDSWDFEICVPVNVAMKPVGRVKPGQWPAMKVARTVYHGPYEGLGAAWGEFRDWIKISGHTPAEDLWECYLVGPESGTDPSTWRTELNRPLGS